MTTRQVKIGALFAITNGEYSDYGIMCFAKATKTFDLFDVVSAYVSEDPKRKGLHCFDYYGFVGWLSLNGYIEDTDEVGELYLGDYGQFDPEDDELGFKEIEPASKFIEK